MHDYENKLISQLQSIANHDPKKYWKFVDTLKESVKKNVNPSISDDEWNNHFRNLLNQMKVGLTMSIRSTQKWKKKTCRNRMF